MKKTQLCMLSTLCLLASLGLSLPAQAQKFQFQNPFLDTDINATKAELRRAKLIYDEGYFEEALDVLKGIPVVTPEINRDVKLLQARIWEEKENYKKAETILKALNHEKAEDSDVWEALGRFYFKQARYEDASVYLTKTVSRNPENIMATFLNLLTTLKTQPIDTLEVPEIFVDFSGDHPGYYFSRAAMLFQQNKPTAAHYFIQSAQNFFPASDNVRFIWPLLQLGWTIPSELYLVDQSGGSAEK